QTVATIVATHDQARRPIENKFWFQASDLADNQTFQLASVAEFDFNGVANGKSTVVDPHMLLATQEIVCELKRKHAGPRDAVIDEDVGYEWPRDITQTFSVNNDVEFRHDRIRQISSWHLELSLGHSHNHIHGAEGVR